MFGLPNSEDRSPSPAQAAFHISSLEKRRDVPAVMSSANGGYPPLHLSSAGALTSGEVVGTVPTPLHKKHPSKAA